MDGDTSEVDYEVERAIAGKSLESQPCDGLDGDSDCIKAENTAIETYVKARMSGPHACIDIDNAEWNKAYAEATDRNLERLKELGLYEQLKSAGIVYDPSAFRRVYTFHPGGKVTSNRMPDEDYEEQEAESDV